MDLEQLLTAAVAAVLTAIVTGLSALAKTGYERRDARVTAQRQLELAQRRTQFVTDWLGLCRSVASDEHFLAHVNGRARAELEDAYADAQAALASRRASLTPRAAEPAAALEGTRARLLSVLLLRRRRRWPSYIIVVVYYAFVAMMLSATIAYFVDPALEARSESSPLSMLVVTVVIAVLLWPACYGLVGVIERTARPPRHANPSMLLPPPAAPPPTDEGLPPLPVRMW